MKITNLNLLTGLTLALLAVLAMPARAAVPTADPAVFVMLQGTTLNGTLTGSDTDVGDVINFYPSSGVTPTGSSLNIDPLTGNFSFKPPAGYSGPASFAFYVQDSTFNNSLPATVAITVKPTNIAPTANDGNFSTPEDTPLSAAVSASDLDLDPLTFTLVTGPADGSLTLNGDGTFTYTPNSNFNGSDGFTFTASDGIATSNVGTAKINVSAVNDDPVANSQSVSTDEDTPLPGNVSGTDPDGDVLSFVLGTGPANGLLTFNGDGSFTYTPNANYNGPDSFTFTADDGNGGVSAPATVDITVNPINDNPVANALSVSTDEDTALPGNVSGSDVDGDLLSFVLGTGPTNGLLTFNGDGSFTYTPNADYNGPDSFTFTADDGNGGVSTPALVDITVNPINDAPTADNGVFNTAEDTPLADAVTGNDIDGPSLTFTLVTNPANGALALNGDGTFTYTPNANYNGSDSFTFSTTDGLLTSAVATATINIGAVNDVPTADPLLVTTDEDTPASATVTGSDIEADPLTFAMVSSPSNGVLTLNPDGSFTYTPNLNYNGSDSFTFSADDGNGGVSAPASVDITINPVNDNPVADAQSLITDEDIALSGTVTGSDVEGDALTFAIVGGPSNGSLTLNPDGTFTYTPGLNYNGSDSFTFTADDGNGGISTPATVDITINPINDVPVADAQAVATDEDTPFNGTLTGSDIEGTPLTFAIASAPAQGSVTITNPSTGAFTYTPDPDYNGPDSFSFTADDGDATSAPAMVSITVNPINDTPIVVGPVPTVNASEDTPISVSIAGVFDDVDIATNGDSLTYTVEGFTSTVIATATLSGTNLDLTFAPDQNGSDTVTIRATDGAGAFVEATVDVNIAAVNDQPVVVGTAPDVAATEDTPASVSLTGVFDDVDIATNSDSLTLTVSGDTGGLVAAASMSGETLDLTFLPDQNGSGTVTVRATDTGGLFVETDVNVTVAPVNDEPQVVGVVPTVLSTEDSGGESVDLSGVFGDVDIATNGDSLTLTVTGTTGTVLSSAAMTGTILDLLFVPNANGAATVTVRATDTAGLFAEALINVDVSPVNDAPTVVGSVPDVVVDEDAPPTIVDFSSVFDDVDIGTNGDVLTLSVSAISGGSFIDNVAPSGTTLTISYLPNQFGFADLTVRATDQAGDFAEYPLSVTVNSVNDAPYVANPLGDVNTFEDAPPFSVNLSILFDDVDIATNGDSLTLSLDSVSNPGLFASGFPVVTGTTLEVALAPDQNGTATVTIRAEDSFGAFETFVLTINVTPVNDAPIPADDAVSMDEDGGSLVINVLDNDYLAEVPTSIVSAGVGGDSESEPVIFLDPLGDPIGGANGIVDVVGNTVVYQPKENFNGVDYFTYTIRDVDGDEASATVTVTVNPVNDPPISQRQTITHDMLENGVLTVDAASPDTVLAPAYDVDASMLDASGNPVGGQVLSAGVVSPPSSGSLSFDSVTGAYTYTPLINFTGLVSFTYRLFDGSSLSDEYLVQINVIAAPPAPPPPPPGEVSVLYNLSSVPLEQTATVPPNVLVLMDDSGSMDWNLVVASDDENGGFVMSNGDIAKSRRRQYSTTYTYLYDLRTNAYPSSSSFGRILPTEEALASDGDTADNGFGVWRARNSKYNTLYYNPEIYYQPWIGLDAVNLPFENADPTQVRLDPVNRVNTIDLTGTYSWTSTSVPLWKNSGGRKTISVDDVYLPYYYATTVSAPLPADVPTGAYGTADTKTKIEIRDGAGPLAGGLFPGGQQRVDCRAGDDNPYNCTYEQELQNFANWFQYYRTREYVTKDSVGKVIAAVQDIRIGYETVNATTSAPVKDMNELYSEGNKKDLLETVYSVDSYGGTPLRQLLGRAGRIFSCSSGGQCPALPAPDGTCQQNFALLFSDGYWNGGAGVPDNTDTDGVGPWDGGRYEDGINATLADTAMYYYETDLFPTVADEVPVSARDLEGAPTGTLSPGDFMHQHMKTYTIAFGVQGSIDPTTVPGDPSTAFSWTDPFAASAYKIDDMLHAAVDGRGTYLNASNPQELRAAFESTFLEFTQAASSSSAAAFNSTSLRDGLLLYRGFYDLRDNTGELTATEVFPDGTLAADPTWRATDLLDPKAPGERVLVTYDRGAGQGVPFRFASLSPEQQTTIDAQQVDFLRGVRSAERPVGPLRERPETNGLLGDIVNSSPVFVGDPRGFNRDQDPYPVDDLYSDFVAAKTGRQPVVYVGANDGMLHGFNAETGDEVFGFVPNKILDGTQDYASRLAEFTSPFYLHKYYVDLTPRLNDVYIRRSSTATTKSWNTVLVGGLGGGGKGFFALNVNDPEAAYSDELSAARSVLWEFTDEDDTYPVDDLGNPLVDAGGNPLIDANGKPVKDLGYALSLPTVTISNVSDGGSPSRKEWVALFGNGLNSTSGIAKLFVLFMDRGVDGWDPGDFVKVDSGYGVPLSPDPDTGYPNGLGSVTAVDRDLNGTVDFVYAGDRMGNLHRFDISNPDPDLWTSTRLFTASYDDGTTVTRQPILTQPLVIKHPTEQGFLIIFGTGSYVTRDDAENEEIQSIYAIWDRGEANPATAQPDTKNLRLVEQVMTNVVDDSVTPAQTRRIVTSNPVNYTPESGTPGVYGWYMDLDMQRASSTLSGAANPDTSGYAPPSPQFPGEKAIRRLLFRDGTVITTTVLPSIGEASCFGARPGAILLFDAVNGGNPSRAVVDFNQDGYVDNADLVEVDGVAYAGGLLLNSQDLDGSLVDLSTLGGEGDTDFLFVSGGTETTSFRIDDINDSRTGRLSWRELEQ